MSKLAIILLSASFLPTIVRADSNFGHWTTGEINKNAGVFAATMNDSGAILGEYCWFSSKTCIWIMELSYSCETDKSYPVLANTDKGAAYFDIVCSGQKENGLYGYTFKNWKDFEGLLKSGTRIGIATPMQQDQFQVFRFLLDGLQQSTQEIEGPFFAAVNPQKPKRKEATTSTATEVL